MKNRFLVYFLLWTLLGLVLYSCASRSTSESSTTEEISYEKKVFTSLGFPYDFSYPSDWYVFELDDEVKVSNSRERLTFPENTLPIDRDDSFLSSFSVSRVEEIQTLFLNLQALIQENLRPFSLADDIGQDTLLPIQDVPEQDLRNIQRSSTDYFNFEMDSEVEYAYSEELNMVLVKKGNERVILIMSSLLDTESIAIFYLSYYNNVFSIDNIKKAVELVSSVSLKEGV